MPPKKKKELVRFRARLQGKRRRQNRFVAKECASKLAESDKSSFYNQEKWLKDDKAPEKPIETIAESSFTSSLASGASFLGCEAAKRETKSREVPCHIKIGWSTVLKVYCSGKEASRKTPGSGLLSIFPGKCRTFKKMYRAKVVLAQLGLETYGWSDRFCFFGRNCGPRCPHSKQCNEISVKFVNSGIVHLAWVKLFSRFERVNQLTVNRENAKHENINGDIVNNV